MKIVGCNPEPAVCMTPIIKDICFRVPGAIVNMAWAYFIKFHGKDYHINKDSFMP